MVNACLLLTEWNKPRSGQVSGTQGTSRAWQDSSGDGASRSARLPCISAPTNGQQGGNRRGRKSATPPPRGSAPPGHSGGRQFWFNIGFLVVVVLGAALLFFFG